MNAFRITPDRSLDREYLRVCAVYQCIKRYRIGRDKARLIANRRIRGVYKKPGWLDATIEIWFNGPLREYK